MFYILSSWSSCTYNLVWCMSFLCLEVGGGSFRYIFMFCSKYNSSMRNKQLRLCLYSFIYSFIRDLKKCGPYFSTPPLGLPLGIRSNFIQLKTTKTILLASLPFTVSIGNEDKRESTQCVAHLETIFYKSTKGTLNLDFKKKIEFFQIWHLSNVVINKYLKLMSTYLKRCSVIG